MAVDGCTLRDLREARGMSQRALARSASVDVAYLSRLERGQETGGGPAVERIAAALGIEVAEITDTGKEGEMSETTIAPLRTPEEVAPIFRVKPQTIVRWARDGLIDCVRPGGRVVRFTDAHVQAYIAKTDTTTQPAVARPVSRPSRPRRTR